MTLRFETVVGLAYAPGVLSFARRQVASMRFCGPNTSSKDDAASIKAKTYF
ncbi:hypothetical protein BRPE64_DCDS08710 (plasmid) [Caballeronia insecticola]|uniref:Uncharacterized protein n=1 Tax=Caballeronia insecticola TaxID=758793 RepID=R4X520_9BURK|nr:hypothetical protein BRPE64_DCDS08710 [Caballeronia insecticola]